MAGIDLRTVAELGGWKTLSMVQRYAHLAPAHLESAVARLVPAGGVALGFAETPNTGASGQGSRK
jgi:hypothetical protein